MNIKKVVVGPLSTNCYILELNNSSIIIDPGDDEDKIIENITYDVKGIIITHSHFDHIGALDMLLKKYNTKKYNMDNMKEGKMKIGDFDFEVIYTKGHMNDAITLYFPKEKCMFVGDFIFSGGIGRIDLEGANPKDMKESIKKILKYPLDTTIYPGHFESTSLKDEKETLEMYANII